MQCPQYKRCDKKGGYYSKCFYDYENCENFTFTRMMDEEISHLEQSLQNELDRRNTSNQS